MRAFLKTVLTVCRAALALALLAGSASATTGTMTLTASKTTITAGESVDFTLSVTDGDPMGDLPTYIMYVNDTTDLYGDFTSNPMTVSRQFEASGTYHVLVWVNTAASNYWQSNTVDVTVQKPALDTVTSLTATPTTVAIGGSVTLKASVTAAGTTVSGGTVTFKDGNATLGTATVAAGKAQLVKSNFAGGSHSITAVYNGLSTGIGDRFNASTSPTVSVSVKVEASGSINLSVDKDHLKPGDQIKLTATALDAKGKPFTTLSGQKVTFRLGKTVLATGTLGSNGAAKLSVRLLLFGTQSMTATLPVLSTPDSKPRTVQVDYFGDPQPLVSGAAKSYSPDKVAMASLFGGGDVIVGPDPGARDIVRVQKLTSDGKFSALYAILLPKSSVVTGTWVGPGIGDGKIPGDFQGIISYKNNSDQKSHYTNFSVDSKGKKYSNFDGRNQDVFPAVAAHISAGSIWYSATNRKGFFEAITCYPICSIGTVSSGPVLAADEVSKRLPGGKLVFAQPRQSLERCWVAWGTYGSVSPAYQLNTGVCNFAVPPLIVAMGGNRFGIAWANAAAANKQAALQLATFDENGTFVKQFESFATLPANLKGVDLQLIDSQHYALALSSEVKGKQVLSMALYDTKGKQVGTSLQLADSAYYPKIVASYGTNGIATKQGYLVSEVYDSKKKTWSLVNYPWKLP